MSKLNTKEHLIQVGMRLVRSEGYLATGVNQVLDAAKVPKGSFYHHFNTKDEFVLEVIRRYAQVEQQRWECLLEHSRLSPLERLQEYFNDLIATYGVSGGPIAGCLLGNISLEVANQHPEIRRALLQALEAWEGAIARIIGDAIDRKELSPTADPTKLAALLVNGWEGAQVRAKALQSDQPLRLFFDHAFDVLLER